MKIAHLLLVHNNPAQLDRLIYCLSHRDADIYIHVDKKTDITPFEYLRGRPNIYIIENRVKVYWGSYNMVAATLNGFELILSAQKKYQYINLLSAQDYPLKSRAEIHRFFKVNPGIAFMNFLPFDPDWREAIPRVTTYDFINVRLPGRYKLQAVINKLLPKRKFPYGMIPVGRSQWFTIPPECAKYILDFWNTHARLRRFIKLTWAPDEFVFQTILYNSIHRDKMVNDDLRYIDWSRGGVNPKTLTMDDADALFSSGKLFARKFDMNSNPRLLDLIDEHNRVNKVSTQL